MDSASRDLKPWVLRHRATAAAADRRGWRERGYAKSMRVFRRSRYDRLRRDAGDDDDDDAHIVFNEVEVELPNKSTTRMWCYKVLVNVVI